MQGFHAFEPADYLFDETPLGGTVWDGWIKGDNSAIDAELALVNYWWLYDALHCFVEGEARGFPEKYKELCAGDDGVRASQSFFSEEFSNFMVEIFSVLGNEYPIQPFEFESLAAKSHLLSTDWTRTSAAYSIWCMDKGMSGLLNNSAVDAAKGFTYSQIALTLAHEAREERAKQGILKNMASAMGRKGAIAKHEGDPIQAVKKHVLDCWRNWQKNPDNYKSQAEFARDMVDKWPELLKKSHETIKKKWIPEWREQLNDGTLPAE